VVEARAAVLVRDRDAEEPEVRHALDELGGMAMLAVDLRRFRQHFVLREVARRLLNRELFFSRFEVHVTDL
jgi:hypothetical protein